MTRAARWPALRFHVLAIALVYALVIPVAYFDQRDLHGSPGWISLDLRGLYVGGYLIGAGILATILLLHLSVKRLHRPLSFGLVIACLFAPGCLVPIGCALYRAYTVAADQPATH